MLIMRLLSSFSRGYTHYSCLRSRGRLNMRGMRSIGARLSRLCVCRSSRLAYLVRNGLPSVLPYFIAAILPPQTKPGAYMLSNLHPPHFSWNDKFENTIWTPAGVALHCSMHNSVTAASSARLQRPLCKCSAEMSLQMGTRSLLRGVKNLNYFKADM